MRVFWLCLSLLLDRGDALSSTSLKPATRSRSSSKLAAVSQTQLAAMDGAEWASLQAFLVEEGVEIGKLSQIGYMTVVTGTTEEQKRVVGIQALSGTSDAVVSLDKKTVIYACSMANIPKNVSDQDAITTLVGSLVGIHCPLPRLEKVGGASSGFVSGKVVVVGSSDYACFCSE
jgi:hypothetical protein